MRSPRAARVLLGLVVALTVAATPAAAQERSRGGSRAEDREAMMERIRAYMARTIQERLDLDEARSAELSLVVQAFDSRRRTLARAEGQVRRRVEDLLAEPEPAADSAAALLSEMRSLREQESSLFAEEQEALLDVLTPLQVLQLQDIREDMGRRIRSLRGQYDRNGRRGGGEEDGRRRRRGGR